jgi:mRNA-degrading endonuclease YafQ of YafQ-DinJ toxin-antitoxin module
MIDIIYPPSFIKKLKKLDSDLRDEALDKIVLFKNKDNHKKLKVHKFSGSFSKYSSFCVNYRFRIVFRYLSSSAALFTDIGDRDVYR